MSVSLERIRENLLNRLAQNSEAIEQARQKAAVLELDQSTNGRLTRMDAMQQAAMESARLVHLETDTRKCTAALARLDQDEYGICCRCGDEIDLERLTHDPGAPFCLACSRE